MNNSVEYQRLYNQLLEIKNSNKKMEEKSKLLLSTLQKCIIIDEKTFKEEEIDSLLKNEKKIIEEIDTIILPLIQQKMM